MKTIQLISDHFIDTNCNFKSLIEALRIGFSNTKIEVPMRHHHDYKNPEEDKDSTLLLMPAFNPGNDLGVKIVTVSPNNGKYDLPAIQGTYIYMDAHKGNIKAILDAKSMTAKRTAATSALASSYLSRENSDSLLMIGTGALAISLIQAHSSVRPIKKVYVWGRNNAKAQAVCDGLKDFPFSCETVENIEDAIQKVAIISCATLSPTPLVFGKDLQEGQHLDLVGAYKKDMREADDEAILKSSVFIDTYQGGLKESGDILIPLNTNVITKEDIKADLFELCSDSKKGRISENEITYFKSVGHALEDLVAASHFYQEFISSK
ncbi:bifunctional Delta(1)-pyrroline-2-carboxylate/Delta(1)-piperideine-2-carboxylate reductase [Flavobacterium muglaense]|uniref:Ornithine cyclodeaminase family protein n=1 Tax=Flavobacterium muglaense TaxID=2764716 RepID=A0A923SK52_9FLAO|nr:ornithine cyclodeaminase family protein [Flavobacterium muglaense]MBC5838398.1 ornithine cyclodeaminase family protein [Flavobacterium muglaense]MBC5844933.1 ornithine cyclodeaminase family protein [Flavobacterium muglaense]